MSQNAIPILLRLLAEPVAQQIKHDSNMGFAFRTLRGHVRPSNQDRVFVASYTLDNHAWQVGVVADGIGSMPRSGEATEYGLAVFLAELFGNTSKRPPHEMLTQAFCAADRAVCKTFDGKGGFVAAACLSMEKSIAIAHAGDARVYGTTQSQDIELLTKDDVLPGRSDLIQYVGIGEGFVPHVEELLPQYRYVLLATDGAYGPLSEQQMRMLYKNKPKHSTFVERLVELSTWLGGHDNATALLLHVSAERSFLKETTESIRVWTPDGDYMILPSLCFPTMTRPVDDSETLELAEKALTRGIKEDPSPPQQHALNQRKKNADTRKKSRSQKSKRQELEADGPHKTEVMFLFDSDEPRSQSAEPGGSQPSAGTGTDEKEP